MSIGPKRKKDRALESRCQGMGAGMRDEPVIREKWRNHTMPCPEPDCEGTLVLKYSKKYSRPFYGCDQWSRTNCNGSIGAHGDGEPLGTPADSETKKRRMAAHDAFDRLWKSGLMKRKHAYAWLGKQFDKRIVHIGDMNREECDHVVAFMREEFPLLFDDDVLKELKKMNEAFERNTSFRAEEALEVLRKAKELVDERS